MELVYKFKKLKKEEGYEYVVGCDFDNFLEVWRMPRIDVPILQLPKNKRDVLRNTILSLIKEKPRAVIDIEKLMELSHDRTTRLLGELVAMGSIEKCHTRYENNGEITVLISYQMAEKKLKDESKKSLQFFKNVEKLRQGRLTQEQKQNESS